MVIWKDLEFRHLEYAIAIKKHGGFLSAAIALSLDQGSLSKKILRMEKKVGFTIFDRTTRPLKVTEAGRIFLLEAEQIVGQADRIVQQAQKLAQQTRDGECGRLEVGINPSIANSQLATIVRDFRQRYPNVSLTLHELASSNQLERLRNYQLDVGFFHKHNLQNLSEEDKEIFSDVSVFRESIVVVLPDNHYFVKEATISLAQLNGAHFILPPRTSFPGLRNTIDEFCRRCNCQPVVVQEAAWTTTILSLVAGDMGISLLPANVRSLQRTGVVYRDLTEEPPTLETVAVRRSNNNSAILRNFLEVIRR
jgi:DNA-binding transcriptional LysR family regulator